ncbi:MAG: hypothetical protein HYT61_00430 [Candidatus Yanofskybacteria bacterium]|nr:hypothetical protein [Candidatus Yanofskybacteria bacterium]
MKILHKFYVFIVIAGFWFVAIPTRNIQAANNSTSCSGGICTSVDDNLAEGATGIQPAQSVRLTFIVYQEANQSAPTCSSGRSLFNVVRHYIAGSATNYEYLSAGSGQIKNYTFSSGSGADQQSNRYAGIFYCWSSSQGTSKTALDSLLGFLGTQGQTWSSPEFNLNTRVVICYETTSCSQYLTQQDCSRNSCNLNPPCSWTGGACTVMSGSSSGDGEAGVGAGDSGGNQSIALENPIGIDTFEELVNVIGVWIFNLAIPIAVIIIIYAGILMLTAGGNPGKFQKGSKALWYAVLGLAIIFIGKGFVTLIESILSLRNP